MARILTRGEVVYRCDVCNRYRRVPANHSGLDVLRRCNITKECSGLVTRVTNLREANTVPSNTPSVEGLDDWFPRRLLKTHKQTVRARTWVIPHYIGSIPNVQVYIDVEDPETNTFSSVETTNCTITSTTTTTTIEFDIAQSGIAECLASSSSVVEVTPEVPSSFVDFTTGGEISIATLNGSTLVDVSIRFTDTDTGQYFDVVYPNVDNIPSIKSPWVGTDAIILNGKRYHVRSFNIFTSEGGDAAFSAGLITPGLSVSVGLDGVMPVPGSVVGLLSTPPHAVVDRVVDKYVDFALNASVATIIVTTGNLLVSTDAFTTTYPVILPV